MLQLIQGLHNHSSCDPSLLNSKCNLAVSIVLTVLRITSPLGEELKTNQQLKRSPLQIQYHILETDLIILPINHFNVILGMDWLTKYRAQIQCTTKTVQISHPPETTLQFRKPSCKLISASKARKLKVHLYQLVDVTITSENKHDLSSVPVVSEYLGHSTWLRSWIRNKS